MYMKKWYFTHKINDRLEFRGWVNTAHERQEDIPEAISGWVTCWPDPKEDGMHGYFSLSPALPKEKFLSEAVRDECWGRSQYAFGNVYEIWGKEEEEKIRAMKETNPRVFADAVVRHTSPVRIRYPRFAIRLEDAWDPDKTYILEI